MPARLPLDESFSGYTLLDRTHGSSSDRVSVSRQLDPPLHHPWRFRIDRSEAPDEPLPAPASARIAGGREELTRRAAGHHPESACPADQDLAGRPRLVLPASCGASSPERSRARLTSDLQAKRLGLRQRQRG